jgi:phage terminase small subunit
VVDWDAGQVVEALVAAGNRKDLAVQYADCFVQYRAASANLHAHGAIVMHPRTSNPIENPFLKVRDSALRALQSMRTVRGVEVLW